MRIIETHNTDPLNLTQFERDQVYNGLDVCVTAEILDALLPQLDNHTAVTYSFSKALQGPVLEMRLRGIRVDKRRKNEVIDEYMDLLDRLNDQLEQIVFDGVGMANFNWRSNPDLHRLFYEKLGIPPMKKGGKPTVNRDALEKINEYLIARPMVQHMLAMRDLGKKIGMLRTEIDPDGRIRTSYNIAGTDTGRFSSSFSEFGTGTNLQNVEEALRSVFVSDKGMKFAKFDAAQIQSRIVGAIEWNLFRDGRYLDACEAADLHTVVAKMIWPNLPWTGDIKKDKDIAETPYYRWFTYRFMCKKIGHGTNFDGRPPTISTQSNIPINLIQEFQPRYFRAFPAHHLWHAWVDNELRKTGYIISITGRKRWFFGRRNDDATKRAAIAYDPQASESFIVNNGMLNIWNARDAMLMFHDHDALTVQYPEEREDEIIPLLLEQLRHPVELEHGRTLEIPYDCKTGWNRGDWCCGSKPACQGCPLAGKANPDGLKTYKPGDKRNRSKEKPFLDR